MSKKYVIKHTNNRRNETNEEDINVLTQLLVAQTDLSLLQQTQSTTANSVHRLIQLAQATC